MKKERSALSAAGTGIFTIVGIVYILPILIVLMNSFKKKVYINNCLLYTSPSPRD